MYQCKLKDINYYESVNYLISVTKVLYGLLLPTAIYSITPKGPRLITQSSPTVIIYF